MANITGASLAPIYQRLNGVPEYHPLEAQTFADWSIEAGDIVTVTRDDTDYESPVHSTKMVWKKTQQVSVSTTGNEKRDSIAKLSQRKYNSGSSGLRESRYQHIYVEDIYAQMKAGLYLTSSSAHLYVDNKYAQMTAGLNLTSSSAHLYVDNKYAQMTAGLNLTSSSAHLYVDNKYAQMQSGLYLTSSSAHLYVDNKYAQMQSGLNLTSSSAHLYVDSKYLQMQSGLALTASSATMYVNGKTSKASILLTINGAGRSSALIEADRVSINGTTTINDVMTISEGRVYIKTDSRLNGDVMMNSLTLRGAMDTNTVTAGEFARMIKSASISNNTLTLTRVDGGTINFSKATWQTGEWSSSGAFTARAKQQNGSTETEVSSITRHLTTGTATWDGNVCTVPMRAWYGNTPPTYEDCNFNVTVDATNIRNAGKNDVTLNNASWLYDGEDVDGNSRKSNTVTVTTNGRPTQLSKSATVYLDTSGSWSGNTKYVYVKKNGSSGEHIAIGTVDATDIRNAGKNDVTLNNAAWLYDGEDVDGNSRKSNTVTVTTNGRPTQLSKSATVYLDTSGSWSGNTKYVYVKKNGSSGEHIAISTVDATARFNAGFDSVTGDDITLQGYGSSPQSSKPSIPGTWETLTTGKKRLSAYIWAKHKDGKWYRLRSFYFTEP